MIKLVSEDTLAHSKAFLFVLENYVALLKLGHGEPEFAFGNSSRVTYFIDGDEIIAATVWSMDPNRRAGTIHFSVTHENHRRQGYYTKIFNDVQQKMKVKGCVVLYSSVHLENEPMIEGVKKTGREPIFYRTKKMLR